MVNARPVGQPRRGFEKDLRRFLVLHRHRLERPPQVTVDVAEIPDPSRFGVALTLKMPNRTGKIGMRYLEWMKRLIEEENHRKRAIKTMALTWVEWRVAFKGFGLPRPDSPCASSGIRGQPTSAQRMKLRATVKRDFKNSIEDCDAKDRIRRAGTNQLEFA